MEDEDTSRPVSAPRSSRKMSCVTCHQRKIRCDKRSPCANCVRNDVLCRYPVEQSRPRPRESTTRFGELSARLGRLERTVCTITGSAISPEDGDLKPPADTAAPYSKRAIGRGLPAELSPRELLAQNVDGGRYINEVTLSRVLDEERELQPVMNSPGTHNPKVGKTLSSDLGGIFHGFNLSLTDVQSYYPSTWRSLQLWQTFVYNVDPVIKILHIPTAQVTVHKAINNPEKGEHDLNALLFAIYFAATTSLSAADALHLLGQLRNASLVRFKQGLEHSLAAANFFDSPSMRSLQAMTIYITSLRAFDTGRSAWALIGLTVRLAQSIGLHRDGSNLGLSPFESEMRRRVWWFLFIADSRTAEDLGITAYNADPSSDTHLPLNVNDSQLSCDMQDLPVPVAVCTEMTFFLIKIELSQLTQQIVQKPAVASSGIPSESAMAQVLKNFESLLEDKYLKYCDHNIPIQRLPLLLTPLLLAKWQFINKQQHRGAQRTAADADEETLISACLLMDLFMDFHTDELLTGFHWYLWSYKQYYLLTYLLWHLCVKPDGPNSERALGTLERSFQFAEHHGLTVEPGSKWMVLMQLRGKALSLREERTAGKNNAVLAQEYEMANPTERMSEFDKDPWDWDMGNYTDFRDWTDMVGNSDSGGFNVI